MTDVPDPTVERVAEAIFRAQYPEAPEWWLHLAESDVYRAMAAAAIAAMNPPPAPAPAWVTRPVKDGKPDIAAMDAADVAEWQETEARAAEIAHDTFDRREEQ